MASVCWWFLILQILITQNTAETRFCSTKTNTLCECEQPGLCTLQCNGKDICKGSDMRLGCREGYPCNIICNSAGEVNACEDTLIDGSLATSLNVICHDMQSCLNAKINCGSGHCSVMCLSTQSTGSNCEDLTLNCAQGACAIECEHGVNMCVGVRINTIPLTQSFECIATGNNNDACLPIHNVLPPFIRTTATPTQPTNTPTHIPTYTPTNIPSNKPTNPSYSPSQYPTDYPSLNPTDNPTHNPSIHPSISPSKIPTTNHPTSITFNPTAKPTFNPIVIRVPTNKPTLTPTNIPTAYPTTKIPTIISTSTRTTQILHKTTHGNRPTATGDSTVSAVSTTTTTTTAEPTPPNYYVVGELTDSPTKQNVNIYANQRVQSGDVMSIVFDNWLYVVIAGGVTLCCFIIVCIKCCNCKRKVAQPAKYNAPHKRKLNRRNLKKNFVHVASHSGKLSGRHIPFDEEEFIPPPPNGPPPNQYRATQIEMDDMDEMNSKEGLNAANVALPDTLLPGIVAPAGFHTQYVNNSNMNNNNQNINVSHSIEDESTNSSHSTHFPDLYDRQLMDDDDDEFEISQIKNSNVELLDDMPLRQ